MSIFLRKIRKHTYVIEKRRIDGKSVQTHLGSYSEPSLRLLYRTSRLHGEIRKLIREEIRRTRSKCRDIEDAMLKLDFVASRIPALREIRDLGLLPSVRVSPPPANLAFAYMKRFAAKVPLINIFRRLSRAAKRGDADAAKQIEEACSASSRLLRSMSDGVAIIKWMVINQFSHGDVAIQRSLEIRADELEASLKRQANHDPLHEMTAEMIVVAYMDAMRCALLAAHRYETKSDAEHFQRLAERSASRFQQLLQTFQETAAPGKPTSKAKK